MQEGRLLHGAELGLKAVRLLGRGLEPVAERLHCQAELAHIDVILQRGAGYQRQLSEFELSNDLRQVTLQLARELRDGLA